MTSTNVAAVVVGAGAMGSAAAWQLARRGVDVALLDRFEPRHANGASHGGSRIFRVTYTDPVYIRLAQEAQRLWRELEDETGTQLLTITGGLEHGGHPYLGELAGALAAEGIASFWLAPEEAAERWPGFRFDTRALFHPETGRLHPEDSVAALQEAAAKLGADVRHETRVDAIEVLGENTVEVHTADNSWRARRVIVAAGAWTEKLLGALVPLPKLVVTQEQPAHFAARVGEENWPSFGHVLAADSPDAARFYGGVYGLATPGEGVKVGFHGVGPIVDPDARDFLPEPSQLADLQDYVRTWLPGLSADAIDPISCTYTTTPDSGFILDRYGPIVVAAGFSGHGFKFTPAIGRVLADRALDLPRHGATADPRFALGPRTADGPR